MRRYAECNALGSKGQGHSMQDILISVTISDDSDLYFLNSMNEMCHKRLSISDAQCIVTQNKGQGHDMQSGI